MTVTPLDLQVLFSKSVDYAENIARTSAATEVIKTEDEKAMTKQRNEATETVKKTNEYDEEFNKIKDNENPNKHNEHSQSSSNKHNEHSSKNDSDPNHTFHRAMLEDGKGKIIDIID